MHVETVAAENFPLAHRIQVASLVAPMTEEYLPPPQRTHVPSAVAPVAEEYFPAPQSVQVSSPRPILYVPAPHSVQLPVRIFVKPASHVQLDALTLPRPE